MKNSNSAKSRYLCVDGPMRGYYIWLHSDAKTLPFRIKNWIGRYVLDGPGSVRWESVQ